MTTPSTQDGGTTNELSSLGLAIPAAAAASKYYLIKINLSPTLFAPHHIFFSTQVEVLKYNVLFDLFWKLHYCAVMVYLIMVYRSSFLQG